MPASGRLLDLLALLGARSWWPGPELAERLEVTERTLRRDIGRLRELGYPIEATSGPYGGYRLGRGGKLPPLVLDDDEAVAVAVALRQAAGRAGSGLEAAALTALTKLDQVLPPMLRERVAAVASMTMALGARRVPPVDLDDLVTVSVACERNERLRFGYEDGSGRRSERHVEPYRVVSTERRWYLVSYDLDRRDWRTFRIDRLADIKVVGGFRRRPEPDAAALVSEGVAVRAWENQVVVRLHEPASSARYHVDPTVGVVEEESASTCLVRMGGDDRWLARYIVGLDCPFEVVDGSGLQRELVALGAQLTTMELD
ncbi:MAG TPA: YafY family protein [Acidimicrobiales bacterium]